MLASRSYEWVLEGDITACFDEIDHTALMGRVRRRIGDKRVLTLIKAFLKAGILSEDQVHRESNSGTPQGGILSPLLANIALEVLDEHFARVWVTISPTRVDRSRRRRHGLPVSAGCATPTTSWSWCPAPGSTPRRCASRSATS